ncbi:hypothetical protein ACFQ07_34185 [Actinomadura adrarensis]|uniref:Uncharacterized protein n=1 Tax=Actinomadura adrarensis TaxID=1819600 RepID=A0ABW3CS93_9ACTN
MFSEEIVHPVIIEKEIFEQAQRKFARRLPQLGRPKPRHTRRCYPLKGDAVVRHLRAEDAGPPQRAGQLLPVPVP